MRRFGRYLYGMIALLKSHVTIKESSTLPSGRNESFRAAGSGSVHTGAGFSYDASRIFRMEAYAHKLRMRAMQATAQ